MILHIGNDRAIPTRDIVAVLSAHALSRSDYLGGGTALDMSACPQNASMRSVLVCERDNHEKLYGSPISACALLARMAEA